VSTTNARIDVYEANASYLNINKLIRSNLKTMRNSTLLGIPPVQYLVKTAPPLFDVDLVRILAGHFHKQIEVLPPDEEFLDGGRLPRLVEGLDGLALDPLVVVVLLAHGHLPDGGRFERQLGRHLFLLRVVEEVVVFGRVGLVADASKVETAKLEALGVSHQQLIHAIQELNEHWR
jgi:hypothetical protein